MKKPKCDCTEYSINHGPKCNSEADVVTPCEKFLCYNCTSSSCPGCGQAIEYFDESSPMYHDKHYKSLENK